MVIMTAKLSKGKLIAIIVLIAVIAVLLAVLLNNADTPAAADDASPALASDGIRTNEDRIAYLQSFGWEVSSEPTQTQEVRIPTEPNEIFERYNDLQMSQGFDLHEYAGKCVKRYVYEVTNHPNGDEPYYATLLIYKDAVIGGDVCSAAKGGAMHGLAMPDAA